MIQTDRKLKLVVHFILLCLVGLVVAFFLSGCSLIDDDLRRFAELTNQFGTPADRACSKMVAGYWARMSQIADAPTPFPSIVSDSYKTILINRLQQQAKLEITQSCGSFAAEILLMIGRANRLRP